MIYLSNGEPMLALMFGNFFRPAYDDLEYINKTVRLIKELGFNCVQLDSKAWEDFEERFRGGEASQYIKSQEHIMREVERNGLFHCFLALYLNGDNLYPTIRFSPPIFGESVKTPEGKDGRWYKYWSPKAQNSMERHVRGLLKLYRKNHAEITVQDKSLKVAERIDAGTDVKLSSNVDARPLSGMARTMLPICSMWDPIVAPSFDSDGIQRYRDWLREQYGDIVAFNKAYQTRFKNFSDISPQDYWFEIKYGKRASYTPEGRDTMSPAFVTWCDNMKWKRAELRNYFQNMKECFEKFDEKLFLAPTLTQWGYFFNIDATALFQEGFSDLWDTAMRGIDMYELSSYLRSCQFIAIPVTPEGSPDPYVTSCEHAIIRAMNRGRDFMGGIFWGRFLYNDLYETISPCETVGSIVASGAQGIWAYGINGLDDGGMLDRMNPGFLESLKTAHQWAKQVIPLLGEKIQSPIAILFPSAMAAFEPLHIQGNRQRRMDLLGWYRACCDLGYHPDVIDLAQVEQGILEQYKVLIIPINSCYDAERKLKAEAVIAAWEKSGGVILHGPADRLIEASFSIIGEPCKPDCAYMEDKGIVLGGEVFAKLTKSEVNPLHNTHCKNIALRRVPLPLP